MSDDYLWDGSGTPDPDVERLERLLGKLRTTAEVPAIPVDPFSPRSTRAHDAFEPGAKYAGARFLGPALASAAAIVAMVGLLSQSVAPGASWNVATLAGTPRIGSHAIAVNGRLGVGQTLVTDEASRARMEVSDIGEVTVDEGTRVRLVETRDDRHRLALERGTLHAVITAPPGEFIVNTPSATATDLGCIYTLHVNDAGSGLLTVEAGWVAFEERGRESFVPAGASARTDPRVGAGTPRYDDAEQSFRDALDEVDGGRDAAGRSAALRTVI